MWLDTTLHQGAGLRDMLAQQELRVLPVLSQSGSDVELETLWQLCAHLQRLGYPAVVLDGTAPESDEAPGLQHLLGASTWPDSTALHTAPGGNASLAVVPAARGLAWLAATAAQGSALQQLQPLFRAYAVLVLYAPAPTQSALLHASACMPLVMTGPGAQGMVRCYQQLKHMALHAGLRCAVAAIEPPGHSATRRRTVEALETLQRSAQAHLGLHIHTTAVAAERPQDLQRLALQLLENGCTIDGAMALPAAQAHTLAPHLDRSH